MNNRRSSGILCAVQSCKASKRTHPSRSFFSFPSDQTLLGVWLEKCGLPATSTQRRLKVCEKHFNSQLIGKRKLLRNSIPEYYLSDSTGSPTTNDSSEYFLVNMNDIVGDSLPENISLKPDLFKKKYIATQSAMRILINKVKRYVKMIKYYKEQIYCFKNIIEKHRTKRSAEDQIDSLPDLSAKTKDIVKMVLNDSLKDWPCNKCMDKIKSKNDIINSANTVNSEPSNIIEDPIDNIESVDVSNITSETVQQFEDSSRDLLSTNYGNDDESQKPIEQPSSPKKLQYECEKCGVKENTYKDLIYHMRVHPSLMLYECERCGKEFHHGSRYRTHSYIYKVDTPFKCKICKKGFKGLRYLRQHQLIHKTEKIHPCPHCDKWFCHMKGLNQHLLCHKEKYISCTKCNKKFQFNSQLKSHMKFVHLLGIKKIAGKTEHVELQKQFTCEICGKLFAREKNLLLHINNIHNKLKKDNALSCSKSHNIVSKKSSTDPKSMETSPKYKCDECSKAYKSQFLLKKHKIIHSGVKEFVCTFCGKAFAFKMYLERHIRLIHDTTNPKNSVCGICGKVSADHANYKLHMLAHTGEMPFHCKFCDLKFRYAKSLRMHVKKKHDNETKIDKNAEQSV